MGRLVRQGSSFNPFLKSRGVLELVDESQDLDIGTFTIVDLTNKIQAQFDEIGVRLAEKDPKNAEGESLTDDEANDRSMQLLCEQIEMVLANGKDQKVAEQLHQLYRDSKIGLGFLTDCQAHILDCLGLQEGEG